MAKMELSSFTRTINPDEGCDIYTIKFKVGDEECVSMCAVASDFVETREFREFLISNCMEEAEHMARTKEAT